MTSEATAKLISASGIAATELAPFAAIAFEGDARALRDKITSLERVPALAELARDAIRALDSGVSGAHARTFERSLADLRAGATVLLRHLHTSDALQHIGSNHAVWVKFKTRLPLGEFADSVMRVHKVLDSLASLAQVRGAVTLEAADVGPLWLKVGLGNQLACELTASATRSAEIIVRGAHDELKRDDSVNGTNDTSTSFAGSEARRLAQFYRGSNTTSAEVQPIEDIVSALAELLKLGIEIHPTPPI